VDLKYNCQAATTAIQQFVDANKFVDLNTEV
jgi:hypothetical protein